MTPGTPPPGTRNPLRIMGARSGALGLARGRLVLISGVFALAYILIAARVVDLTLIQGGLRGMEIAASALPPEDAIAPAERRADITDRNGVLLATSLETASLYADPELILDPEKTAKGLAAIFPNLSYGETLQKLQGPGRFAWVRRNLTPQEQYAVLQIGQPGLNFKQEMRRVYPQGDLAAHILGYANIDGRGLAGIERSFDRLLRGSDKPLALSLDVRLQYILQRELEKSRAHFSAKAAAGVVMDIRDGQVLAAVSLPGFDPHHPGGADPERMFNRVTLGVYELGSMFKAFSTAAYLELKGGGLGQTFDAREPLRRGRFTISDYHAEKRVLTIPEIFMYSSNIGAALMGEAVGAKGLEDFYADLGLMKPMEIEIGEVGMPLVPAPWRDINTATAAYGHGIAVSPMQLAAGIATIAGDGLFVQPTLVLDQAERKEEQGARVRVVSAQTAHRMRQLMRLAVTEGTGEKADVPGYHVGGKTGTAEKPGPHGYDRNRLISSFVGVFPAQDPRYVVLAVVDEPHGTKDSYGYATGGWVAAPVVGKTIAAMGALLGIPVDHGDPAQDIDAPLKQYIQDAHDKAAEAPRKAEPAGGTQLATY